MFPTNGVVTFLVTKMVSTHTHVCIIRDFFEDINELKKIARILEIKKTS